MVMPDERVEQKIPNMLAVENAGGIDVASEQGIEVAGGDAALSNTEPAASRVAALQPEQNVVALPKREAARPRVERDPTITAIDALLEAGLREFVDDLQASDRTKFIAAGEELTAYIAHELDAKHPNYTKTLSRITAWLHMLPMLSKEYLRQEAKRKNDEVMQFAERHAAHGDLAA